MSSELNILLAQPRGFCAGVERAIEIVERAIKLYGAPVYVRHEIVHNKWVVDDLKAKGVVFVKEVDEIPDGAITIFSAHGISQKVENEAKLRDLPAIDATCPLVTKVHNQARRYEQGGHQIILIGHAGHPEVEGTSGRVQKAHLVENIADVATLPFSTKDKLAYVTQTTLSVDDTRGIIDALRERYPQIEGPDVNDICYATQNRQNAVRDLADRTDLVLVVGSKKSSNSNRLRDLSQEVGTPAHLIENAEAIDVNWLEGVGAVGITAGASAPEILIERVIAYLQSLRPSKLETLAGAEETVVFKLPPEVRGKTLKTHSAA
jgi:4-hydroxy-3-methylbut-2-enyl diphosphate reductase